MRVAVLGSGSAGNSLVLQSGGHRLVIDAGFSCREMERRLRAVGVDPESVEAVVVTHEHGDHARGADRFSRRHRVPVFATRGTLESLTWSKDAESQLRPMASGWPFEVAGFAVEAFSVPHDARDPVGLVVEDEAGCRLGLIADLGVPTRLASGRLRDLHILVLETNHDLEMLRCGPYPWALKQRVASRHGHLSNRQAAESLPELLNDRLLAVVLYHLSRTNNMPALAASRVAEELERAGSGAEVTVTRQTEPSAWLEVAP